MGFIRLYLQVVVTPHTHEGVFAARGAKADSLVTRNLVVGESVYGEKRMEVVDDAGEKIEYRVWNPFRSKLGATILGGVKNMPIKPGSKVLYLGAANGTTVSHVSDIVGPVSFNLFCVAYTQSKRMENNNSITACLKL